MEFLRIIGLSMLAAISYGFAHDLFTAHLCVEYFSVGHPNYLGTDDPLALALFWGVVATWWLGAFLGFWLAIAARAGGRPRLAAPDLVKPLRRLLSVMAVAAVILWVSGYYAARLGWIWLVPPLSEQVPAARHASFLADGAAHLASYAVAFMGGIAVIAATWRRRGRLSRVAEATSPPD